MSVYFKNQEGDKVDPECCCRDESDNCNEYILSSGKVC